MRNYKIIKVGRNESNDIVIENPLISRFHAEFFIDEENNIFLTDLNSTFGTFVNEKKILEPIKLNENDNLSFGREVCFNFNKLLKKKYQSNDLYIIKKKGHWLSRNWDILVIYLINIFLFFFILYF